MAQQHEYQPNQERLEKVIQELEKPDPKGYKGEPLREYRKELGHRINARGPEHTIESWKDQKIADQSIAKNMVAAGFSERQITTAIGKGSPAISASASKHEQKAYGSLVLAETLQHEQVKKAIGESRRDNIRNRQGNDKRLEHLKGLSSKNKQNQRERYR